MTYIEQNITWEKQHNDRLQDGEIWLGSISAAAAEAILQNHAAVLLECYIDPDDLRGVAEDNGLKPGELLRNEILPDAPHIRSGDSGEILARSVLQEWRDRPRFPAFRWRSRAHKNDTVRGPDLIGYAMHQEGEPSNEDLLVMCEVKTRSVTVDDEVVKKAFEDAKKHYISRLANSLYFLQVWLRQEGQEEEARRFARFTNPHESPYLKRIVPCVVHKAQNWQASFLEELPETHELEELVEVTVICVESLDEWIEAVHEAAVACAG